MTCIERVQRTFSGQRTDRAPVFENFWAETVRRWTSEGHLQPGEHLSDHFDLDLERCAPLSFSAGLPEQVVEETEDTVLRRNGNGALLRTFKRKNGGVEHVDYAARDARLFDEMIAPRLAPRPELIDRAAYREARRHAQSRQRFFNLVLPGPFSTAEGVMGIEHLLIAMCEEPDWARNMLMAYARLAVALCEELFAVEGPPDGFYMTEDMGLKGRPFFSPAMYESLVQSAHQAVVTYAHSLRKPFILHSCGCVLPLVPHIIKTGVDCLQPLEVRAGMDPVTVAALHGERLCLMGGNNVSVVATNDRALIAAEMERVLPALTARGRYIFQSDHSIPDDVDYDTYRYFLQRGKDLCAYGR